MPHVTQFQPILPAILEACSAVAGDGERGPLQGPQLLEALHERSHFGAPDVSDLPASIISCTHTGQENRKTVPCSLPLRSIIQVSVLPQVFTTASLRVVTLACIMVLGVVMRGRWPHTEEFMHIVELVKLSPKTNTSSLTVSFFSARVDFYYDFAVFKCVSVRQPSFVSHSLRIPYGIVLRQVRRQLCRLVWHCSQVLMNQCVSWLLHGVLLDPYQEFFVQKNIDPIGERVLFKDSVHCVRETRGGDGPQSLLGMGPVRYFFFLFGLVSPPLFSARVLEKVSGIVWPADVPRLTGCHNRIRFACCEHRLPSRPKADYSYKRAMNFEDTQDQGTRTWRVSLNVPSRYRNIAG